MMMIERDRSGTWRARRSPRTETSVSVRQRMALEDVQTKTVVLKCSACLRITGGSSDPEESKWLYSVENKGIGAVESKWLYSVESKRICSCTLLECWDESKGDVCTDLESSVRVQGRVLVGCERAQVVKAPAQGQMDPVGQ
ncbi:uncharacterized protein PITG_13937 [Phytophthora infestans T30-4]|uniref:Uncharacterized protein n=1 Tax=Phytophthora infestans (strain T30-4) TaxID=403677 RepID=D0NN53_PHYIT|nr:uncharacterized protein PITG_13937 [Phytophthora infestans T30-4]EEY61960.1 hypothetical protein PITG_13937 [Phytophthora infestans T30-4]|eukprot:XP_002899600.1 hypothetical protein PITG_13937 [Phytophthora infestans T30-4]